MWMNNEVAAVGDTEIWLAGAVARKSGEQADRVARCVVVAKSGLTQLDQRLTDIFWAASDAPRRAA